MTSQALSGVIALRLVSREGSPSLLEVRYTHTHTHTHGYGMQFESFYSLNQNVVAWFAHLHQVGFQPTLTNLGKCLWW
jgi:hypothetical protein